MADLQDALPCGEALAGYGATQNNAEPTCALSSATVPALPAEAQSPVTLRQAGNERLRCGDGHGAAKLYERALELLEINAENIIEGHLKELGHCRELATLYTNLSAARLTLPSAALAALEAADTAIDIDETYPKAYFRRAKALLQIGRPNEAANTARLLSLLLGGKNNRVPPDVKQLLNDSTLVAIELRRRAAERNSKTANGSLGRESKRESERVGDKEKGGTRVGMGIAELQHLCTLETAPEIAALVAPFCDGHTLAWLGRCARRFHTDMTHCDLFIQRAKLLAPERSVQWLRADVLKEWNLSAGWHYAYRSSLARFAASNRLAVCGIDGRVRVVEPVPGGGTTIELPVPCECVPFSLCWGPRGEYLAFTGLAGPDYPENPSLPTLVLAPLPASKLSAIVTPLRENFVPYYICPSPCGTRLAMLGALHSQQVLVIADVAQVLAPDRELAPPISLHVLGKAAPLYLDWAAHGPELLLVCRGFQLVRVRADVLLEKDCATGSEKALEQRHMEPALDADAPQDFGPACAQVRGNIRFRAPQWLAWPGASVGRWLVPRSCENHVSLALLDPESGSADVICEHLPPTVHFSASRTCSWVAWSGLHDDQGHGGVFVRRLPPTGSPLMVFNGGAEALAWAGDRLALLLRPGTSRDLVWAVWDPPTCPDAYSGSTLGSALPPPVLLVAPVSFMPSEAFGRRVLPFFDQFERRLSLWSPSKDALVYADVDSQVWVQPFPLPGSRERSGLPVGGSHPLANLVGAAWQTELAPPPFRVSDGSFVCWSPE